MGSFGNMRKSDSKSLGENNLGSVTPDCMVARTLRKPKMAKTAKKQCSGRQKNSFGWAYKSGKFCYRPPKCTIWSDGAFL